MKVFVLASGNKGKAREFAAGLGSLVDLRLVSEYTDDFSVEETGATFHENARLKAEYASNLTGLPAIADDSGLSVYYLGGEPGVQSARFAGAGATDTGNNRLLLERMVGAGRITAAHFTCSLCLKVPGQPARFSTGRVFGHILREPRGSNGFGYDPLFQVYNDTRTLAEMSVEEKNIISHRGQALKLMSSIITEVI